MKIVLHTLLGARKRAWALVMALILLAAAAPVPAQQAAEALPAPGDRVAGFTVKRAEPMEALGAQAIFFEHDKTGAQLLYLKTKDTNRSFNIAFQTPALDEKGKPHVFEHITIAGSQKYPDANMFFPFTSQTYNTYVNAYTYQTMTSFPLSSLSEDQLMLMMDYYLSGVFTPLLYTEPRLAQREAWRYELTDQEDPLAVTGTVYTEMKGATTLEAEAALNLVKALYPGSAVAHNSGGDPEAVRTLTYDELIAFHDAYYHPSNALITLYGDLDYERFLTYIDSEYLSKYDRKEILVEKGRVEPLTETATATYEYPVEADAQTEGASVVSYGFAANGADMKDVIGLSLMAGVLNMESSAFMALARERMPGKTVYAGVNYDVSTPYLFFKANGCDEADRDTLVSIVDETIAGLAQTGFDADAIESNNAAMKLSLLLTSENTSLGVNASLLLSNEWAAMGSIDYFNEYEQVLAQADTAYFDGLFQKYLLGNAHRAAVATVPAAGLAEQNAQALADELAKIKAGMTDGQLGELVSQSQEFIDWAGASPSAEEIGKLQVVTKENLPEEIVTYDLRDETVDGVRLMSGKADVSGVCMASVMLDASNIPLNQLQDAALYLGLIGSLDTEAHTKEELSTLTTRYAPVLTASISGTEMEQRDAAPLYRTAVTWMCLDEDIDAATALAREILRDTLLTDTDTIKSLLERSITAFKTTVDSGPYAMQMNRCAAAFSDASAFNDYLSGIDHYRYMQQMAALAESDPAALTARLENAKALLLNRRGATVMVAGDETAVAKIAEISDAMLGDMPSDERAAVDYGALRVPVTREAIVTNCDVQFNFLFLNNDAYSARMNVLGSLVSDMYMLPKLRNALGAYGAYANFTKNGACLWTYRDPNLAKTYEIYGELPEFLETVELTQEDIDRYIISSYSGLAMPTGPLTGAMTALTNALIGRAQTAKLDDMRDVKAFGIEDVRASAALVRAMLEKGVRSTSGTASAIEENAELFDAVIRLDD